VRGQRGIEEEGIARLQDGQRQVVTDLLTVHWCEYHMSSQRAFGIHAVEEHDLARKVLL
jgi:hypothetical protein